ncbi:multiple inositol polyphosphate phosphatase 1-like isoform X2 [Phymastichus coffea]|uniref:multiple inositol polyphosphate phosphatase 1-like isoform X2 n=1 Tax=Phymastichus coffea TaxID=108790 RepID=UPI00273BCE8F|nr:multiple inositol polyphosphate phosphatase 1-like isoform X2 [Phymastichus coffea]
MLKVILLLFLQICISTLFPGLFAQECFNDSNKFYCQLNTKTPYRFVANYNDSQLHYPGCTEKKIWMMIRHGTRFPGKKHIKKMKTILSELKNKIIENFNKNNSELSVDTVERLTEWRRSFNKDDDKNLALEGEHELVDLAERMQARFPKLLPEDYSKDVYKFKYTNTQRAEKSAKSFALGLFGQNQSMSIGFPEAENKDPILRFYKRCDRWKIEVDENPETYKEKNSLIQSQILGKVLDNVSKRVGFKVNYEEVYYLYMICAFETAWDATKNSSWCDLLSLDDVKVLEYVEDLELYWVDGYGHELTYKQACPALRDMFTFFDSSEKALATAYFSHSGTVLKLLSILGVAKDDKPLTFQSYSSHLNSRKWKSSLIDAFASNIAFVLYDCEKQGSSILLLHQEREVQIPGCSSKSLCPVSQMKDIFPDTEQECRFNALCSV